MSTHGWFQDWHGAAKISAECIEGLSTVTAGGSTGMSTGVTIALSTKASIGHQHPSTDVVGLVSTLANLAAQISTKAASSHLHTGVYEPANANIQAHIASSHAPSNAQKNSDILKAEIEAVLTGEITSHSHAGGPGGGPATVKSTAGTTINSTFSNVTGLSFAVSSASAYYFEFFLTWNVLVSTNGVKFAISGPAAPTLVNYQIDISTGAAGSLVRSARAYDTCAAITAAGSSLAMPAWIGGVLITGANAGTLIARAAPRVTSTNMVVSSGSVGVLYTL